MPSSSPTDFTRIPVIDVSALAGNDAAAAHEVADDIRRASVDVGFFYVTATASARPDARDAHGGEVLLPTARRPHSRRSRSTARYPPIVAGEYITGRYDDTYSYRQPARST